MADLERTVTPELALAAARVLRDFCDIKEVCDNCPLEYVNCCGFMGSKYPCAWDIPERKKDGDLQR